MRPAICAHCGAEVRKFRYKRRRCLRCGESCAVCKDGSTWTRRCWKGDYCVTTRPELRRLEESLAKDAAHKAQLEREAEERRLERERMARTPLYLVPTWQRVPLVHAYGCKDSPYSPEVRVSELKDVPLHARACSTCLPKGLPRDRTVRLA